MIIVDIQTGEEFEIDQEAIDHMDRQQEEYQRKLDEDLHEERSKRRYQRDFIN